MIAFPAPLDIPRELMDYVSRLLAAERRARGTRRRSRALACWKQALFLVVVAQAGRHCDARGGFDISPATAYRYHGEGVTVLAAQAPDLHEALLRAHDQGLTHLPLDGKLSAPAAAVSRPPA